jgi:hypothetical protein
VDPKKIEAMQDWPHPKTLKSLRGFLGLTWYYQCSTKTPGRGDAGTGDAKGGRVGVPPNFRDFWEMGDGGTSHI